MLLEFRLLYHLLCLLYDDLMLFNGHVALCALILFKMYGIDLFYVCDLLNSGFQFVLLRRVRLTSYSSSRICGCSLICGLYH